MVDDVKHIIRVAIFEDYKDLRNGLYQLINGTEGLCCTGAFPDCGKLIKNIEQSKPDVVLMDIKMPGISGIEAAKMIRAYNPAIRILMQTVFEDDDKIFAAICAGASGYILKKTAPAVLLESIREVYNGGAPLTGSIAGKVLQMFQKIALPPLKDNITLSAREKEILACLVNGMSYKMIAESCSISYDTVRFHMKNIYEKLHVNSMTEAVAKAINQHIV
jgi:DNA-binding NarL/FixJ family response regulator